MLQFILTFVHVLVGIALILIVLLQAGKGASLGAAFGGSSQTIFGSRGPGSFLGKITTIAAGVFMITSLTLAIYSGNRTTTSVPPEVTTESQTTPSSPGERPAATESKGSETGQSSGAGQIQVTPQGSEGKTETETAPSSK